MSKQLLFDERNGLCRKRTSTTSPLKTILRKSAFWSYLNPREIFRAGNSDPSCLISEPPQERSHLFSHVRKEKMSVASDLKRTSCEDERIWWALLQPEENAPVTTWHCEHLPNRHQTSDMLNVRNSYRDHRSQCYKLLHTEGAWFFCRRWIIKQNAKRETKAAIASVDFLQVCLFCGSLSLSLVLR